MTKLLVGLGNPGDKYFETKHNVGFMLISTSEETEYVFYTRDKIFQADLASFYKWRKKIYLVTNDTYMRESGKASCFILTYYGLDIDFT